MTLIVILLCTIPVAVVWIYVRYFLARRLRTNTVEKFKVIEPLMRRLASNETVTADEILTLVKNPSLRCGVFRVLEAYKKIELFPIEYMTQEKGAEGFLVSWLEFPTELGIAPDEIETLKKVTLHENELAYYVFKFRTKPPHWAAHFNWLIGVSGPYTIDTLPYDEPERIFSRFNPMNSVSPEMEVQWVHQNIAC